MGLFVLALVVAIVVQISRATVEKNGSLQQPRVTTPGASASQSQGQRSSERQGNVVQNSGLPSARIVNDPSPPLPQFGQSSGTNNVNVASGKVSTFQELSKRFVELQQKPLPKAPTPERKRVYLLLPYGENVLTYYTADDLDTSSLQCFGKDCAPAMGSTQFAAVRDVAKTGLQQMYAFVSRQYGNAAVSPDKFAAYFVFRPVARGALARKFAAKPFWMKANGFDVERFRTSTALDSSSLEVLSGLIPYQRFFGKRGDAFLRSDNVAHMVVENSPGNPMQMLPFERVGENALAVEKFLFFLATER